MGIQSHRTIGTVGESGPVEFTAVNRERVTAAVLVDLTVTVPMSFEDVVAALWGLCADGSMLPRLVADVRYLHEMVMETVMADGLSNLTTARWEMAAVRPGSEEAEMVGVLRGLVARVYGPAVTAPAPRREMAGVSR